MVPPTFISKQIVIDELFSLRDSLNGKCIKEGHFFFNDFNRTTWYTCWCE